MSGILILTPFYPPNVGGVETHLQDLTDYLEKDGRFNVYILTYQPITTCVKGECFKRYGNIHIRRISWIGFNLFHKLEPCPVLEFLYITPWLFINALFFLLKYREKISVIHAQGFNCAFIGRILAAIFRKRLVVSIHAIYNLNPGSLFTKLVKWSLKKSERILTLSEASKSELVNIGLSVSCVSVYTYWIDQNIFSPSSRQEARQTLGWPDKFTVLFVGRFIEKKGMDILCDLARDIKEDILFAFIGDGPLADELKHLSGKFSNIRYVGKVDNKDLPLYYNSADILCVPSKYEEGFGRVIIEALSCGVPVVASRSGGIPEAVNESVGVLVEPSVEEFKKAILELFHNRERLNTLRENCRDYALKKFGLSNAQMIVDSYSLY